MANNGGSRGRIYGCSQLDHACRTAARDAIRMPGDFLIGRESELSPGCRRVVAKGARDQSLSVARDDRNAGKRFSSHSGAVFLKTKMAYEASTQIGDRFAYDILDFLGEGSE